MDALSALSGALHPFLLSMSIVGAVLGIIIGAIPGLNGPIGVAVLLPLTFAMDPASGLTLLGGIYMGCTYGGAISAILLNCPGNSESACTALEGYAMTRKGEANAALNYAILSSTIGGFSGCLVLLFLTPLLANIALAFGPPEMLMVILASLTFVASMSESKLRYGILAVALGLFFSTVGPDFNTGDYRFTMGIRDLKAGISLVSAVVGLFAVTEMLLLVTSTGNPLVTVESKPSSVLDCLREMVYKFKLVMFKAIALGTWIGVLPATGTTVAAFVAYGEMRRSHKHPEKFGTGLPEGIISPEMANNTAVGGCLVPTLALGVPGSATAAIMYGALTMHNIIPGPNLMIKSGDTVYAFMGGMFMATLAMAFCGIVFIRLFVKVVHVPIRYIVPTVLVASLVGTYSINNTMFDVYLALAFGFVGIIFRKTGVPIPPLLLGLILGPILEQNLLRSMSLAASRDQSLIGYMVARPVCLACMLIVLFLVYKAAKPHVQALLRPAREEV